MTRQNDQDTAERSPKPPDPPVAETVTGAADAGANPDRPPAIEVPGTDPSIMVTAVPTDTGGRKKYTFAFDLADGREELKTVRGKSPGEKRVLRAAEVAVSLYEARCSPIGGWSKAGVLKKVLAAAKKASEAADAAARRTARDDATAPAHGTAAATAPAEDAAVPNEGVDDATNGRNPASPPAGSTFDPPVRITCGPRQGRDKRIVVAQALPDGGEPVELHRDKFDTDDHAAAQKFAAFAVMAFVNLYGDIAEEAEAIAELVRTVRAEADRVDGEELALEAIAGAGAPSGRMSADDLVRLVKPHLDCFHDGQKEAWVRVRLAPDGSFGDDAPGPRAAVVLPVGSEECDDLLRHAAYRQTDGAVSDVALAEAKAVLRADALFGGPEEPVFVRVGSVVGDDGRRSVVLDLADGTGRAVVATADGWAVTDAPGVNLYRPATLKALPEPAPAAEGDVGAVRGAMNVRDEDWTALSLWMFSTLLWSGTLPVLYVHGPHGAAKSSTARNAGRVIDPQEADLLDEPKEPDDLIAFLRVCRVAILDNLEKLPDKLSNLLCRVATGAATARRKLYTNFGLSFSKFNNSLALTGIDSVVTKPDLLDRTLVVQAVEITKTTRRLEAEVEAEFLAGWPRALAGLMNGAAAALKAEAENRPRPQELPRLADFAVHADAAEAALGLPPGAALRSLWSAAEETEEAVLDSFPAVREAISIFAIKLSQIDARNAELEAGEEPESRTWREEPEKLWKTVSARVKAADRGRSWPNSPEVLTGQFKKVMPLLRRRGVAVQTGVKKEKKRWTAFTAVDGDVS